MPTDALSVLCAQLTRDLLAIAKFLFSYIFAFDATVRREVPAGILPSSLVRKN